MSDNAPTVEPVTGMGLLDFALVLAEHIRVLLIAPILAGLAILGISYLFQPTFTAVTRILPPAQQQSTAAALAAQLGGLAGLVSGTGLKNPADQYVALLKSRSVYDAIVDRFRLKELYDVRYVEDARKVLENRSKIYAGAKDGVVTVEIEDHDPSRAADMANAFVEELRNLSKTLAIGEAAQRRLFFEIQLKQTKENLANSEILLRGSGVSEAALKVLPQSALEALARLQAQITAQEIKLASMRTFMTESNPQFHLAIQELSALRAELAKLEQTNISKVKGDGAEYIAKFRDFKYHETLFELVAKQYELARLDEAREGAVIQVIDEARPPERKSKPKRALLAVLTTLATVLLVGFVVLVRLVFRSAAAAPHSADKMRRLQALLSLRRRHGGIQ